MFISTAWAQGAGGGGGGGLIEALIPLALIFAVFYFLLIRPQQRKVKVHREMLSAIRRGDRIITGGGIYATVTKVVGDDELVVQIADGVRVRVARGTVAEVLARSEPARPERKLRDEKAEKSERAAKPQATEKMAEGAKAE